MLDFYCSLPKINTFDFYIKGYTEVLELVRGVRLVPNRDFLTSLDKRWEDYFYSLPFPYYFIPIFIGYKCIGFILKGEAKKTIKYSVGINAFNLDAVYSNLPFVILVEGIKDAYVFLQAGLPTIAILTNIASPDLLDFIKKHNKKIIFIPDNDSAGESGLHRMKERLQGNFMSWKWKEFKDSGDYFNEQLSGKVIRESDRCIKFIHQAFSV